MKKVLIILTIVLFAGHSMWGQKLSSSPFSRYGVGDILFQGNGRQVAMGNTGIADFSSYHISKINPATLSALKPNSVIFEVSFFHRLSDYSTGIDRQTNNVSNFKQLMGGFRVARWWHTSFGISPYSGVGYRVLVNDSITVDDYKTVYATSYSGNGGNTQIFWGNSFTFLRNFSLGATVNYNFGAFNRNSETLITDSLASFTSDTKILDKNSFHKVTYDLGFIYQDTIRKNNENFLKFSLGAVYSNKFDFSTVQTLNVSRSISAYGNSFSDSILFDTLGTSTFVMPQTFGGGFSFTFKNSYTLSADYLMRKWLGSSLLDESNFTDSRFIGLGFEYVTDPFSTTYYKTIRYRLGAYQNNSYKIYNNNQINTQAITFGIGLPLKTIQLNLGFVIGTTGSIDLGLQENFYEFNLSVSLYDLWFVKRKFM